MPQALWLVDKLEERGLDVVEHRGWQTRTRPVPPDFRPRGVVCHHTGLWSTIDGMVKLCINGRPDLAGPLCQVVLDPSGVCHVIAAGRANHAGAGGWRGLKGNESVLGIEAIHSGDRATPWPPVQVETFVRCAAALADGIGADPIMVCGHKEWTPSKIDPITLDMADFRAGDHTVILCVADQTFTGNPQSVHSVAATLDPDTMTVTWGTLETHSLPESWGDKPRLAARPDHYGVLVTVLDDDDGFYYGRSLNFNRMLPGDPPSFDTAHVAPIGNPTFDLIVDADIAIDPNTGIGLYVASEEEEFDPDEGDYFAYYCIGVPFKVGT